MDDQERDQRPPQATLTTQMVQALHSLDVAVRLNATTQIRRLLSVQPNPPIDEVIQSGIVPQFVHFLKDTRYPELHFEAARVLIKLAVGNTEQIQVLIEVGAILVLIRLITASPNVAVIEAALCALANIAIKSPQARDAVLNSNLLPPLLDLFNGNLSLLMMQEATVTLGCLCLGTPPPNFGTVSQCLTMLGRLIFNHDPEVLKNVCMALSNLCDGPSEQVQAVLNLGICRRAVRLLDHSSTEVVTAALCLVGSIVLGDTLHIQVVIDAKALPAIGRLLSHEREIIVVLACRVVNNISAGSNQQLQALIEANLISRVIELLAHRDDTVRRRAAWPITNATFGSRQQIAYIVQAGAIPPLCQVLAGTDSEVIRYVLTGLDNILQAGKEAAREVGSTENDYATLVEQCGGLAMIRALLSSDNLILKEKASLILENYFTAGNRIGAH